MGQTKKREALFAVYYEYLKTIVNETSLPSYINIGNILQNNEYSEAARLLPVLLPKLLARKDDGKVLIERLIGEIEDKLFIYLDDNNKSYLRKFFNYIENITEEESEQITKQYEALGLSDEENEFLNRRKSFTKRELISKFKSRLRTQDRVSGDKIWLPLRYIAKIYRQAPKSKYSKKIEKDFSTWLQSITDNIYIHFTDDEIETSNNNEDKHVRNICHAQLKEIDSLILEKDKKTNEFLVLIKTKKGKTKHVLTPTGKGNEKVIMTVKNIRDIAIDHVIPIDSILRQLEKKNRLPMLKIVSDSYKALQELEESNENEAINELLKDNTIFNLNSLYKELKYISEVGPLRLMAAKYNSQKSNELAFKKIYLKEELKEKKYEGIIEVDIKNGDDDKSNMILYQKLEENGVTRIKQDNNDLGKEPYYDFENIEIKNNKKIISEIIDYI